MKSSDRTPAKRKRSPAFRFLLVLARAVIAVIVVTAFFNAFMYYRATREAGRMANTPYGRAFESVDYEGDGDAGVLLLHGIYGTPQDFRLLMKQLERERVHYYAPMLGGDRPTPLAGIGYTKRSLAHHAQQAYEHLSLRSKRIVVVGLSLGAIQATYLAARHEVRGLVIVSPAFGISNRWYLPPSTEWWVRTLALAVPLVPKDCPARINDEESAEQYAGRTTTALPEVAASMDYARAVLAHSERVRVPVLCILSRGDDVIDLEAAEQGVGKLASEDKRIVWYTRSNHTILADHDREAATREIFDFLTTHLNLQTSDTAP